MEGINLIRKTLDGVSGEVVSHVTELYLAIKESPDCAMFGMTKKEDGTIIIGFETGCE